MKDLFDNNVSNDGVPQALKAEFMNRAGVKLDVYREQLKFCKKSILRPREEYFPDMKSLENGKNVF